MSKYGNKEQQKVANKINNQLIFKYNADIALGTKFGKKLTLAHNHNIVIGSNVEVGDNFACLHNVTIGQNATEINIKIGNNVIIGTGSVILGGKVNIGDNVIIGAMTLITKDISDNSIVYTRKETIVTTNRYLKNENTSLD